MAFVDYFNQFIQERHLNDGSVFTLEDLHLWFEKRYPAVKPHNILPQLLKKTTNHPDRLIAGKYKPNASTVDDYFYSIDPAAFSRFQLYQGGVHDPPYYPDCFVHEKELQSLFTRDPTKIEAGLLLVGGEYPAGNRRIDLLCLDQDENFVVIELKLSLAYDQVVGQLLRYMGWVKKHLAKPNQIVRGVIVADKISEDLKLAVSVVPNVRWLEFKA